MSDKPKLEECPACNQLAEPLPDGSWAECPECGMEGCDDCIPGGRGCLCVDCDQEEMEREDDEEDKDEDGDGE